MLGQPSEHISLYLLQGLTMESHGGALPEHASVAARSELEDGIPLDCMTNYRDCKGTIQPERLHNHSSNK